MTTKTLTIQWNEEQLPILPLEPEAHLSFATHDDGNELELDRKSTRLNSSHRT